MKRPAIFFDRDNTLIVNDGYLGDPAQVKLVPGAADAVARARALGYATIVVSNQSGVARGLFNEGAVYAVNDRMDSMLLAENPQAVIDRHEFCPFHPDAVIDRYRQDSPLRKPKPGMILAAAEKLALDVRRSWIVGDAPRDIEAGHSAGCRSVLFKDPSLPVSPAAEQTTVAADFVAGTLQEAIDFIATHPAPISEPAPGSAMPTSAMPASAPGPRSVTRPAGNNHATKPVTPVASLPAAARPIDSRPDSLGSTARLEALLEQILLETRRRHEQGVTDFSVSKLMAGIVQVIVLAVMFLGYLRGNESTHMQAFLMLALTLQTMVIALLIMSRRN